MHSCKIFLPGELFYCGRCRSFFTNDYIIKNDFFGVIKTDAVGARIYLDT